MSLLKGKKGLIMGVANDRSIAWGIAKKLSGHGAELAFTYLGDALKKRVIPLAESLKSNFTLSCDVEKKEDVVKTFDDIKNLYMRDPAERKKSNILRIVAIAKDYDQSFFTDEFEEQMKELLYTTTGTDSRISDKMKKDGKFDEYKHLRKERVKYHSRELDLLIEHENGFSPLWLS